MANIDSVKLPNGNVYNMQDVVTPRAEASQPNLLINGWFTVNQRGVTSGSLGFKTYGLDRWMWLYSNYAGSYSLSSSGLTLTPSASNDMAAIAQIMESDVNSRLNGKNLTASLMYSDGTIVSGTIVRDSSQTQTFFGTTTSGDVQVTIDDVDGLRVRVYGTSKTIKAVKLEIGSTSTLHLDTAPDYATELLKCQRYFVRWGSNNSTANLAIGYSEQTTEARFIIYLPVPMRNTPTISTVGTFKMTTAGTDISITSITVHSQSNNQFVTLKCSCAGGLTTGDLVKIYSYAAAAYIDLSAEL